MHALRWFTLVLVALGNTLGFAGEPAPRPTLTGIVTDETGKPVEGATVYIWTAAVKTGYSTFCPSCYADCGKRATSGPDGTFQIPSLDPDLRFEVLTVRDGYAPTFAREVDPAKGESLAIKLPARPIPANSANALRGTLVDASGKPIPGAWTRLNMVNFTDENGQPSGRGGRVDDLDPVAIANDKGEFTIVYSKHPITGCDIELGARGFATRRLNGMSASQFPIEVTLREGGMIRGRLMNNGKPVPNAQMVLTCKEREMSRWLGDAKIGTNENGEFLFSNVSLYEDGPSEWYLAAAMDSMNDRGGTTPIVVTVSKNGEDVVVPDIQVKPGHKVTGRVVMPDGIAIPEGSRILIESDTSWDQQQAMLDSTGRFEFTGLWNGNFEIHPSVKGYQVVGRPIGTWFPPNILINNADVTNFELKLEPTTPRKPRPAPQPSSQPPSQQPAPR
ncbi:MAG: carboxypeptidase regulatory-like domain-containing protein [Phycisphaerae bacterium]|nr:carboxypeptidase regulatory-like domain-containing protein [Phycisphaerae bacterium]